MTCQKVQRDKIHSKTHKQKFCVNFLLLFRCILVFSFEVFYFSRDEARLLFRAFYVFVDAHLLSISILSNHSIFALIANSFETSSFIFLLKPRTFELDYMLSSSLFQWYQNTLHASSFWFYYILKTLKLSFHVLCWNWNFSFFYTIFLLIYFKIILILFSTFTRLGLPNLTFFIFKMLIHFRKCLAISWFDLLHL